MLFLCNLHLKTHTDEIVDKCNERAVTSNKKDGLEQHLEKNHGNTMKEN